MIKDILKEISNTPDCIIHPIENIPEELEKIIPNDLLEFFHLCGGVSLFIKSNYPIVISSPKLLIPSNIEIIGEQYPDDPSSEWYIIGRSHSNEAISIDLSSEKIGKCYDSFYETHGVIGSCQVVATSFDDLLSRLLKNKGQHWYWLKDNFQYLGDAYD